LYRQRKEFDIMRAEGQGAIYVKTTTPDNTTTGAETSPPAKENTEVKK
jgi:hypothetical protein